MKIHPLRLCFLPLVIFTMVLLTPASGQTSYLVVEKPGTVKNHKYVQGNEIAVKANYRGMESILRGRITALSDSTITINGRQVIHIEDITTIFHTRNLFPLLTDVGWKAGSGFFLLDVINGLLTKRKPVIQKGAVIISGSLIAVSLAAFPFIYKKLIIDGRHWRIKMLINSNIEY